jgi:hypothetical protein
MKLIIIITVAILSIVIPLVMGIKNSKHKKVIKKDNRL